MRIDITADFVSHWWMTSYRWSETNCAKIRSLPRAKIVTHEIFGRPSSSALGRIIRGEVRTIRVGSARGRSQADPTDAVVLQPVQRREPSIVERGVAAPQDAVAAGRSQGAAEARLGVLALHRDHVRYAAYVRRLRPAGVAQVHGVPPDIAVQVHPVRVTDRVGLKEAGELGRVHEASEIVS